MKNEKATEITVNYNPDDVFDSNIENVFFIVSSPIPRPGNEIVFCICFSFLVKNVPICVDILFVWFNYA